MSASQRRINRKGVGSSAFTVIPRAAIRTLDALIRRVHGVHEFTDDELCLLRIAVVKSDRDITLSNGTIVTKGETIGELHLWNEHIPAMPKDGADFTWGMRSYSMLLRSFRMLALYITDHPEWASIRAWRGESSFVPKGFGVPELFYKLGFDVVCQENPACFMHKFVNFWQNLYWWMLAWTFNPASLEYKKLLKLERWQIWISSAKLQQKYGSLRTGICNAPKTGSHCDKFYNMVNMLDDNGGILGFVFFTSCRSSGS